MSMDEIKKQAQDAFDRETGITRVILTCSCGGMYKKAAEAFCLLFPQEVLPDIIRGRDRIYKFAKSLTPPNDHILAISKLSGKYAYYIELDKDNKIIKEYDLLKGVRIG